MPRQVIVLVVNATTMLISANRVTAGVHRACIQARWATVNPCADKRWRAPRQTAHCGRGVNASEGRKIKLSYYFSEFSCEMFIHGEIPDGNA